MQAALKKERAAVHAALEQERAESQAAFEQRLAVQAGGAVSPFVPSSPPPCSLPTISPHFLIIPPTPPGSLPHRLPSLSPSPHRSGQSGSSSPCGSGPSGGSPRSSGSPEIIERGDDSLTTPPPPSYPSYRHFITVPPLSPRSHHPSFSPPRLSLSRSPGPPVTPLPHTPHLPNSLHSSMPNHVTGGPPWPHQCQHERQPEVQALLAAGAYEEAEDEVGGWVGGWAGVGGHTKEERAGLDCVHS